MDGPEETNDGRPQQIASNGTRMALEGDSKNRMMKVLNNFRRQHNLRRTRKS